MKLNFTTLDVFSVTRYAGNPVAIIQVPASVSKSLSQAQKQCIASEFNLSEIVFLHQPAPGTATKSRRIDIFTSHAEVPFAGHPTIGSAHYLLNTTSQTVTELITKAGKIPIESHAPTGEVKASVPFNFHVHGKTYESAALTGAQKHQVASIVKGMSFIYVVLPDLEALARASIAGCQNVAINTYDASSLDEGWRNGLIGTMYLVAQGVDEFRRKKYRTRMFGTREDPGTGSASSGLACWLAGQEPREAGKGPFRYAFEQGVEMGRRNLIAVEVTRGEGGVGIEKVVLSGAAVTVMEGSLEI